MGMVRVLTAARMEEIEAESIVGGVIDSDTGHLILTRFDGTTIDAGYIIAPFPSASESAEGIVKLASSLDVLAGTSTTKAITPAGLIGRIATQASGGLIKLASNTEAQDGTDSAKAVTPSTLKFISRSGTTTERDNRLGIPGTDLQKAALANQKPTWYNTDLGWTEGYYADNTLSGLTVQGLETGIPTGWYPTGEGPECVLEPTSVFNATTGNYVGNWNGRMRRRGGSAWFVPASTYIQMPIAGIYDLSAWTALTTGTGTPDIYLRLLNSAGTSVDLTSPITQSSLSSSYYTRVGGEFKSRLVLPGERFQMIMANGALNVHLTSAASLSAMGGQMVAKYIRPPLVTD